MKKATHSLAQESSSSSSSSSSPSNIAPKSAYFCKRAKKHVDIIEYTKISMIEGVEDILKGKNQEEKKIAVNEKDANDDCAVIWAAKNNDLDIMKLLVEAGASLDVWGDSGISPLNYARINQSKEMEDFICSSLGTKKQFGHSS